MVTMGNDFRAIDTTPAAEKRMGTGTYLSTGTKTKNITDPQKIMLDLRRREAMRLRQEEGLTMKEIRRRILEQADRFWEDPSEASYSLASVSNDLMICLQSLADEARELARQYLPQELLKLELREDKVEEGWHELQEVRDKFMGEFHEMDAGEAVATYRQIVDMIERYDRTLDRIQARRSNLLPLQAPKRVEVDQTTRKLPTLDELMKWKEQMKEEGTDGEVIEGEFSSS